jgi:hypothetical protein
MLNPLPNICFKWGALLKAAATASSQIDALRQYKEEILEAYRSGLSVHRIAQIFRERGVVISVPHLVRTVRRFVDEEERVCGKASTAERYPEAAAAEATKPIGPGHVPAL